MGYLKNQNWKRFGWSNFDFLNSYTNLGIGTSRFKDLILPDSGTTILDKLAVNNIPFEE